MCGVDVYLLVLLICSGCYIWQPKRYGPQQLSKVPFPNAPVCLKTHVKPHFELYSGFENVYCQYDTEPLKYGSAPMATWHEKAADIQRTSDGLWDVDITKESSYDYTKFTSVSSTCEYPQQCTEWRLHDAPVSLTFSECSLKTCMYHDLRPWHVFFILNIVLAIGLIVWGIVGCATRCEYR